MSTQRGQGIALVVLSALLFSTTGLFTKGVEADAWSVVFWRGLFAALFIAAYLAGRRSLAREIQAFKQTAFLAALIGAGATAAFLAAFKYTSIANVALIYGTAPLCAGVLGWMLLGVIPDKRLLAAAFCALVGVGLIFWGSAGSGTQFGDFLAVLMVIGMALMLVVYRRFPEIPSGTSLIVSCLLLMAAAPWFTDPLAAPYGEILILAAFGLVFAVASVAMVEGAMRLAPAETALIGGLEAPLAPLWAFMVLAETPPKLTWVGGAIILFAIFSWQMASWRTLPLRWSGR